MDKVGFKPFEFKTNEETALSFDWTVIAAFRIIVTTIAITNVIVIIAAVVIVTVSIIDAIRFDRDIGVVTIFAVVVIIFIAVN